MAAFVSQPQSHKSDVALAPKVDIALTVENVQ